MKLITYCCFFTLEDAIESFAAAHHLWHLAHIFPVINFAVNNTPYKALLVRKNYQDALNEKEGNTFFVSVTEQSEDYIKGLMDVLKFTFSAEYPKVKLFFIRL